MHIIRTHHWVKTYLIDLILATSHKKDGESMCKAFEGMIDKAEDQYGVIIVTFCCDNDGGSQRGRKDLVLNRLWLFGPPCCAHQVSMICMSAICHMEITYMCSSSSSWGNISR